MPAKAAKDPEPTNTEPIDVPGINPPEGVKAKVKSTVEYDLNVDPDAIPSNRRARRFIDDDDELAQLAAEEAANLEPPDPLAAFLEDWGRYAGYNLEIVRLPDPATRRMPGSQYVRPCFEVERIGGIPFDPINFIGMMQMVNGDSGGIFRFWLTDHSGQPIPGARMDRLVIADPPRGSGRVSSQQHQSNATSTMGGAPGYGYAPATERQPTEMEKQMQRLQTRMMESMMERLLNPPPVSPQQPLLPDEDRLALLLLQKGDLLGNVVSRIVGLAQAPDQIEKATWKDKLVDLATQNPTLVARVNDTIGRIADRLFSGPQPAYIAPPTQHAPQATPAAAADPSRYADGAPTNLPDEAPQDEEDEEEQDMALLEEIINLLSSDEPIAFDNPIFRELEQDYPRRFPFYVTIIARTQNANQLIDFIIKLPQLPPVYAHALTGPMREHYLSRAEQLRQLCIQSTQPRPQTARDMNTDERANEQGKADAQADAQP